MNQPDRARIEHLFAMLEMSVSYDGSYREFAPPTDLAAYIRCFWRREVGAIEAEQPLRVYPDGCMDLLWMHDQLLVAGPDTVAWRRRLPAGTIIHGARFHPGAAATLLNLKPGELLNDRAPAELFTGRWAIETSERLYVTGGCSQHIFEDALRERLLRARTLDPLVREAVRLALHDPGEAVSGIASTLAISERHLHRRATDTLGYGMKRFISIARLQRAISLAESGHLPTIADLAIAAGYADQAHLTREMRRMTGLTPAMLIGSQRR